jgi:hypothetical protein
MKKGRCWGFAFTGSKVPPVSWFLPAAPCSTIRWRRLWHSSMSVWDVGRLKKLVGWLKFTGIGMEVQRMKDWPEAGALSSPARKFHWWTDSSCSTIRWQTQWCSSMSVWVVGTLKSYLVRWNLLELEWKFSEWKRGGAGALSSLARKFH